MRKINELFAVTRDLPHALTVCLSLWDGAMMVAWEVVALE
jgi:hypothetical protein